MAGETILIVSPVFNDWEAAARLVQDLDETRLDYDVQVLFVDDGSTIPGADSLTPTALVHIREVSTLHLQRNVGHQRAIAIGLAYAHRNMEFDAAVVMDSDGEDNPRDIPRLVEAFRQSAGTRLIFAERKRRSEDLLFRLFYQLYLVTFRTLTGFVERTGNFSIIPRSLVQCLVASSELWMHYASAVSKLRILYSKVSTDRGVRYHGRSQMNTTALIIHGLQAIAVHREIVAVRVFLFCLVAAVLLSTGMVTVFAIRFMTDLAIPGWATNAAGMLAILFGQILSLGLYSIFLVLGGRSTMEVIPMRDYAIFVRERRVHQPGQLTASASYGSD